LLGIQDVEAFCARIIERSGLELRYHDREDLLAYLIETAWDLSLGFEPEYSTVVFSTYCGTILRRRVVDWQRRRFGRSRWVFKDRVVVRPRVDVISIDASPSLLDDTLDEEQSDREASSNSALAGLLGSGSRQRAQDLQELRLEPPR